MNLTLILSGILALTAPVATGLDLNAAAQRYAETHATPVAARLTPAPEARLAPESQPRRPAPWSRFSVEARWQFSRSLGFNLPFQFHDGYGPRVEFRPTPWMLFWGGPLYNPRDDSVNGVVVLKFSLWRFSL
jgi:hypothetical protein